LNRTNVLILVASVAIFALMHAMDFFDNLYVQTRVYEHLQLDEWLNAFFVAVPALALMLALRTRTLSTEVRHREQAEAEACKLANYDVLTDLANRRLFRAEFDRRLASAAQAGTELSVLLIDLDRFKIINDLYGHATGDALLGTISARIRSVTRSTDLAARIGGDEFAILSDTPFAARALESLLERLLTCIEQPITAGQYQLATTVSIGVASYPKDGTTADELLGQADQALYQAKAGGKNCYALFDDELAQTMRQRHRVEADLRRALIPDRGEIVPYFQPIFDLPSHRLRQFEVLARWNHPEQGLIEAQDFAAIAEDIGLSEPLYRTILRHACSDAASWDADISISVNVSPAQFADKLLVAKTLEILAETGFPANRLELEITETALVQDFEQASRVIRDLRRVGIRVALDDFGTGYSGLRHLHALTVDHIKIDRSFVEATRTQNDTKIIVSAMIALGHTLGMTVTAEGIEDTGEEAWLIEHGCDMGQGFLFSHPLTGSDAGAFSVQARSAAALSRPPEAAALSVARLPAKVTAKGSAP
jgi:diguanylate cyclase (GGDEF)-like protein